jgi:hypothetical protein
MAKKKYNLSAHEVMHSASIIMLMFEEHCAERVDSLGVDTATIVAAKKASQALFDFYQAMGVECLG